MSYILDALQKAERQRELGQVPGIDSVHEPTAHKPAQRWPWVLAAVLILGAVVVGGLYWFLPARMAPTGNVVTTQATTNTATNAPPVAVQPKVTERPSQQAAEVSVPAPTAGPANPTTPVQAPPSAMTLDPGSASGLDDDATQAAPSASAVADANVLKPLPLPPPEKQSLPQPARSTSEPPVASPAPSPGRPPPAVSTDKQLPVWPLVSPDVYQAINARLNVDVHVYSKVREKRFVFINMKIYHEGDELLEGPTLERITPDGAVLSYRGERFRVPAR